MNRLYIVVRLKISYFYRKRVIKMFSDNLSHAVLRLCTANNLTYEMASEYCELSPRYFGDIARGRTNISIVTLEKLCNGFSVTPDGLLLPEADSLQIPMAVREVYCFRESTGVFSYPVCPHCHITMEREYQNYCDRCGQRLDWCNYPDIQARAHRG